MPKHTPKVTQKIGDGSERITACGVLLLLGMAAFFIAVGYVLLGEITP
jgi:hypothetical protein